MAPQSGRNPIQAPHYPVVNTQELKEWIRSLTWDELAQALEVYEEDDEFLMEMIRLQVPPPTPIHPRTFIHPIASGKHPLWDGKYETEYLRTRLERIQKPRLLKWLPVDNTIIHNNHSYDDSNTYRNRKKFSNTSHKSRPPPREYNVMARGFVMRDGNRYSIPPTYEQQEADEKLLQRVCLCTPLNSDARSHGTGLYLRLTDDWHPINGKAFATTETDPKSHNNVLHMLRIVSRGSFLSRAQNPYRALPNWFQPTERWFSLSMYLAARFEMALVQSYHESIKEARASNRGWLNSSSFDFVQRIHTVAPSSSQFASTFGSNMILEAIQQSASVPYIRDCLLRMLLLENGRSRATVDNDLSPILHFMGPSSSATINLLWACPLVQVGSAMDQLRTLGREVLQKHLARQVEQELLFQEIEEELGTASNSNKREAQNKTTANATKQTRLQTKRKSRSRSGKNKQSQREIIKGQHSLKIDQNSAMPSSQGAPCQWAEVKEEETNSSDEETQMTRHTATQTLDFPENADISIRARNRNIVLILGLLDDIVQDVFGIVGLSDSQSSNDVDDWNNGTTKRSAGVTTCRDETKARTVSKEEGKLSHENLVKEDGKSIIRRQVDSHIPKSAPAKIREVHQDHASCDEALDPNVTQTKSCRREKTPDDLDHDDTEALSNPSVSGNRIGTTQGVFDIFASPYGNLSGGFFLSPESIDFAWDTHDFAFDQWSVAGRRHAREQSIMEDLFLSQERREQEMASSTIASIASSGTDDNVTFTGGDDNSIIGNDDLNSEEPEFPDVLMETTQEDLGTITHDHDVLGYGIEAAEGVEGVMALEPLLRASSSQLGVEPKEAPDGLDAIAEEQVNKAALGLVDGGSTSIVDIFNPKAEPSATAKSSVSPSPAPQSPDAPATTASPILVSLADLQLRKPDSPVDGPTARSSSSVPGGAGTTNVTTCSASAWVHPLPKTRMVSSLSRENLRSPVSNDERTQRKPSLGLVLGELGESFRTLKQPRNASFAKRPKARDDTDIKNRGSARRRSDALESYRTATSRSLVNSRDDHDVIRLVKATPPRIPLYRAIPANKVSGGLSSSPPDIVSAQSEIGNDDYIQNWHDSRRSSNVGEEGDNISATRDGSTTITSAISQREVHENLREERDTYRDLCLTLGAEVAKLRNMLASQNQIVMAPPQAFDFSSSAQHQVQHLQQQQQQPLHGPSKYFEHPASFSHLVTSTSRSKTLAAMSEYRGEYESMASMASEDDFVGGGIGKISSLHQRQSSSAAASDTSVEHSAHQRQINFTVGIPNSKGNTSAMPLNGVQSRLSVDIAHFVDVISSQLRKQESKRAKSVERMTRLVTALWPRAQVKLYGSHVTGLCLPTSDVDFIICLPAVQKDTPAVAPGVLEGRNAINESSQKVLARKLKNESWIDPRSMKLIERTVVPVIKVATKDTKAKTLRLDITFDSPSHHGLEAVELVNRLLGQYPMIRPLVLVLKQFLLDRGLHTGYTGGLSSYCLFLMTARYLQEQAMSWADCGALLMGLLDFYGNHVSKKMLVHVRLAHRFSDNFYSIHFLYPSLTMLLID